MVGTFRELVGYHEGADVQGPDEFNTNRLRDRPWDGRITAPGDAQPEGRPSLRHALLSGSCCRTIAAEKLL